MKNSISSVLTDIATKALAHVNQGTPDCKGCKGTGIRVREAFTYEGRTYPEKRSKCISCNGVGRFEPVDIAKILVAIQGRDKAKLCSKRPADGRTYFIWRLARFHGGADVTMPFNASMEVHNDPFVESVLDPLSELVAYVVFGTNKVGSHRWGRALGILSSDVPGLPDSAYSGGRTHDHLKPEEEALELR